MKKLLAFIIIFLMNNFLSLAQNIVDGDFEQVPNNGWELYSKGGYKLIGTGQEFYSTEITPNVQPRSGSYMARLGGFEYEQNSIAQNVQLPSSQNVYLGLFYQTRASTISECGGLWVGAEIRVYVAGQILYSEYLCNYYAVNDWTFAYFDISAVAGQNVQIGFRADAANSVWSYLYLDDVSILTSLTDIPNEIFTPETFFVNQNYPNPFNPETIISYNLPINSDVSIKIFNLLGEVVKKYDFINESSGFHELNFNASEFPSGIYFYKVEATANGIKKYFVNTKKMIFLK